MNNSVQSPLVSVCVVAYNHADYIEGCLLSLLLQTCSVDIEILVGDDASTDATSSIIAGIAQRFPGRVQHFRHEQNLGPSGNYQYLIARARGKFLAHLDGDDYWLPGKLHAQLEFMEQHQDCVAVYTNAVVITTDGRTRGVFNNWQPETFDEAYLLARGNFLNHSSMLYRATARHRLLQLQGSFIDYRIHLQLAQAGTLGYVNSLLVGYRVSVANSMTTSTPDKVRTMYWEALAEACERRQLDAASVSALSAFIAATMFEAFALRRPQTWLKWARCARQTFPAVRVRVACASCVGFLRLLWHSVRRALIRWLGGTGLRVYFFR